jgi:5-methylcytosine-specific restriction endonuclease McrA
MEIDSRRLYLGEGCASMFVYCTQVLQMSEGGAYNRIEAARAARVYPLILELLEQGAVTMTAVRLLAPHLTPQNHRAVLTSARRKSKREVEVLVATLHPRPDAPTIIRKLPSAPEVRVGAAHAVLTDGATEVMPVSDLPEPQQQHQIPCEPGDAPSQQPVIPRAIVPLAPERYRMQLTLSRETHDRFRRAQALLRHAVPSGDAAEIVDRAIRLLLEHLERTRCAQVSRPGVQGPRAAHTRRIPAAIRRAVWQRDDGRCAFTGAKGRCGETGFLEFHHVVPYAVGGEASVENIQLRCRAHNAYEARLFFEPDAARESRTS